MDGMPEILLLFGSPHTDGATARLTAACLEGLDGRGAVTRFDCFTRRPASCDDCGFCRTAAQPRCRRRDLDDLYAALERAGGMIVATPVYNRGFPAPLKAALDRFQCYWSARFIRGERPPIALPRRTVLLTAAGSGRGDGAYLQAQLAPLLTVLNSAPAVAVHADGTDRAPLSPAVLAAARAAGKALAEQADE